MSDIIIKIRQKSIKLINHLSDFIFRIGVILCLMYIFFDVKPGKDTIGNIIFSIIGNIIFVICGISLFLMFTYIIYKYEFKDENKEV